MSCNTNDRPIDIPPSISLSTPSDAFVEKSVERAELEPRDDGNKESDDQFSVTMPSSHVVEISQTFYWPLYSKPIDWIYNGDAQGSITASETRERCRRVAELLHSLEFIQNVDYEDATGDSLLPGDQTSSGSLVSSSLSGDTISRIMEELEEEKEDWFSDLSGGQRSKVELVRKVFLMEECPHVLLIDETMAPLDPRSKALVMARIKSFCAGSVVIVIYHTDVGSEKEKDGALVECVPSNDFFDGNIHVEEKMMNLRPLC